MQLVEQHFINKKDNRFKEIDELSFKSKNLYNRALYLQNQSYQEHKVYINYNELDKLLQQEECYKQLPAKVSQQVLLNLHRNWLSYFEALKTYQKDNSKFKACPRPPKYKNKTDGRNVVIYTKQAIGKNNKLSKTEVEVNTSKKPDQIRIIPKRFGYMIEVVHTQEKVKLKQDKNKASIDLGLNNLISITSNCAKALIVNGRILKSINQYCNKLLSKNPSEKKRIQILKKHYFRSKNYLHHSSKTVLNYCLKNNITEVVIGYNEGWKESINCWKKDVKQNQKMVAFHQLLQMLKYKFELYGINVLETEESYTSQSSYYDNDPLPKYKDSVIPEFSGKRVKRGLYKLKDRSKINADLNGSLNIGRKVIHDYVVDRSLVARPLRVNPLKNLFL